MIQSSKMISYAQNFEDVILWRALKDIENGFYLDIGAQDPRDDSVSALFYENGWRGVHVEPSEKFATLLRAARPDEEVVQAAVGPQDGKLKFYEVGSSGLNTCNREVADRHFAEGLTVSCETVPSVRLSTLLERYADRAIHWLKIDVEGTEGDVIESWEPAKLRPWILVIESTLPNSPIQNHEKWEPKVISLGYRFAYFDGLNRFYVHKDHADRMRHFGPGPNIFDGFLLERSLQFYHRAALALRHADETALAKAKALIETYGVEVERYRQRSSHLESQLHFVYQSTSWRVTTPLRGTKTITKKICRRLGKTKSAILSLVLRRGLSFLGHYPDVKHRALQFIQRFPHIERRAFAFVLARLHEAAAEGRPVGVDWKLDPDPRSLSAWQSLLGSHRREV